jgi:hypothetical protein
MNPPLSAAQANYLNLPRSGPFVALDELAAIGRRSTLSSISISTATTSRSRCTISLQPRLSSGHPAPRSR